MTSDEHPRSAVRESLPSRLMRGTNLERLAAFSDAVFAIALTLLALDIRIPAPTQELADAAAVTDYLRHELAGAMPKLIGYLISFAVIAGEWGMHFRFFEVLAGYDRRLIRINLALLLIISLMPFPTSVFADYAPNPYATGLYGLALCLIFVAQLGLWTHAHRARLLPDDLAAADYRSTTRRLAILAVGFAVSTPAGFVTPWATVIVWVLTIVVSRVWRRGGRAAA